MKTTLDTIRMLCALALGILLVMTGGCDPGVESLVAVRGRVFYRGVPLHTGSLVFTPNASRGTTGQMARADIQPDGRYVLHTGDRLGAKAGWYRVTVVALADSSAEVPGQPFRIPHSLLPEKYRDPDLSGLQVEIKADQENTIDWNLD